MDQTDTSGATSAAVDGGFLGTVNDVLGAINNLGVTAANVRDRWNRDPGSTTYAVPVPQGSQPGRIAAVNQPQFASSIFNMTTLFYASLALLAVGVTFKLLKG